jgi:membrane fusion protein, multidrug efflux system
MKKTIAIVALAVVCAGVVWFALTRQPADDEEKAPKPAARVETVTLQSQSIAQTLEAFGIVEPAQSGEQTTPATFECAVVAIHVVPGAHVVAGEVIMEIAPSPDGKLQLEAARTALDAAAKSLVSTQERYDLKLATSQELLIARQTERDARAKLESYERRGMSGDGKLRAPVAGVVSKLDLLAGSLVAAGAPLFAIAVGDLEAHLSVEGDAVAHLAINQPVTLRSMQQQQAESIQSTVRVVGRALNPTTGAADVRVSLPSSSPLLLGEHVRAVIELRKKDNVLVVPRTAVLPDEDQKQVLYTVKDGKASRHEVEVGIASADLLEVQDSSLHAGDAVVTLGNYELEDGMSIQGTPKEDEKP